MLRRGIGVLVFRKNRSADHHSPILSVKSRARASRKNRGATPMRPASMPPLTALSLASMPPLAALLFALMPFFATLLAMLFPALFATPAYADMTMTGQSPTLSVSPTRQELTFDPGKTYDLSITVTNAGGSEATFIPAAGPYYPTADGNLDYSAENDHTQLWNWISFAQDSFTLAPGAKAEVNFAITVPADAPSGGQYAAVYAEVHASEGGLNNVSRVGSLIVGRVDGEIIERGELLAQNVPTVVLGANFTPSVSIKNTGNVNFAVVSRLYVKDILSGNVLFDSTTDGDDQQQVYPDMTRTFSFNWEGLPGVGIFEVEYTVNFAGQSHSVKRTVWAVPLWLLLTVIGVLAFLVIFGWMAFAHSRLEARRQRKAQQKRQKPKHPARQPRPKPEAQVNGEAQTGTDSGAQTGADSRAQTGADSRARS